MTQGRIAGALLATLLCAGALAAPLVASAADTPMTVPDWKVAGSLGLMQFVIIPQARAKDRGYYDGVIKELCPSDRTCFLRFYTNSTDAKPEVPLPDAIAREPAAMFQRSTKQGNAVFQWACRIGVTAGNCF
jgi:hypothetical protein